MDITGYEKTKLEYLMDEAGKYYYQLPYTINLEKSRENIENNVDLNKKILFDENLVYDNIIIEESGKISMPPTNDFENMIYEIIGCVERKEI